MNVVASEPNPRAVSRSVNSADPDTAFGAPFWLTYVANAAIMTAVGILFRYADFVHHLGGSDWLLGAIVGTGMIGSLAVRIAQGVGIDRYGPPRVWLVSSLLFVASCLGHLLVTRADGPEVFLLRIAYSTAIAGILGSSTTYVSLRAPANRLAEVIGSLGTSGFLGMMLGSLVGDALCAGSAITATSIERLFLASASLGSLSFCASVVACWIEPARIRRRQPPPLSTLRRYHPGPVALLAIPIGVGLCWPHTFLRPFAQEMGIPGIAIFFWAYSPVAFLTRIATRRLPDQWGVRPMLLTGMALMIASQLVNPFIRADWQLLFPAALLGMAHATIYPALMVGGTAGFPDRYRGLATAMMLGMLDLGFLVGSPLVGTSLSLARWAGWPAYPTMFGVVSAVLGVATLWYALATRPRVVFATSPAALLPTEKRRNQRKRTRSLL